jgi:nitroimidazol reductase NimA-like FMN-containing flavoprotein (pyridoxamine 5'-phosphate oxidase superfamily)
MKSRVLDNSRDILDVIQKCDVCYVSMVTPDNSPYLIPMNFGFADNTLLLHSAKEGKKIDILKNNPKVCVVFSTDHQLRWQHEKVACSWSMKYRSVLAYGEVEFVDSLEEKEKLLRFFMKNYSDQNFKFSKPSLKEVQVLKVPIQKLEGKAYGF